jgi:septum formation protein
MDLVLASTSRYRRELLARLGIPFRCLAPDVDEDAFKIPGVSPRAVAERLAHEKASRVAETAPGATVIGGDQLVALDGRILGKPGSREAAEAQLRALAGRAHELVTAIVVAHEGRILAHTDVAVLEMRPLDEAAIGRYLDADAPYDCAGAYKLEARGITLFSRISAADHSAITGLPLIALTALLGELGFVIP